jgi:hypothetical protein
MGYLGHRQDASLAGTSFIEIPKPTECVEGGWLFGIVNNNGIEGTHTMRVLDNLGVVDTGWTLVDDLGSSLVGSSNAHLWLWRRKVQSGEGGVSGPTGFRFDNLGGNRTMAAAILAYDELSPTDPIADILIDADGGSAGTSVFCPDITTTEDNMYVIRLGAIRANVHVDPIGGYTERVDFNTLDQEPTSGASFQLFWHEFLRANAGTTAAPFVNQTAPTVVAEHVGASLVLANPPVVPPEVSTLAADGVAASSGYADASTANIANIQGNPDTPGGTGFTAS